ncbi:4'-phosphopantetheinyl transferase superfamily protein [Micromonospora sp. NPDC047793]|uniref:holo-ACP synthase n=1 Tax=unclassified Micromonospora TaxID=2617518 RepID=UPI001034C31A|nr:4'-phosphopantetheinyl transferase superfamily protein [Verrucosispora sp. SN26_14.1]TBL44488.1 4'-phosphopantetheinyl transferase superfamily protein [Verrucosispora sp. SN26_14.1]
MRLGIDLLPLGALDRLCERAWFTRYAFAAAEIEYATTLAPRRRREFLAGRFAAKEAVFKVLGTGLFEGVAPSEIVVARAPGGAPQVTLAGAAARMAAQAGVSGLTVSITHSDDMVAAVAAGW